MTVLRGIGVSSGVAVGPVHRLNSAVPVEPPAGPAPTDAEAEAARIAPAAGAVAAGLRAEAAALTTPELAEILEASAVMAEDPGLLGAAEDGVRQRGLPAARALWEAAGQSREQLLAAGAFLAERVSDLDGVRDRIVAALNPAAATEPPATLAGLTRPVVLIARDLAPADALALDRDLVLALVLAESGPTSHTAIVARALGIPAVVACPSVLELAEGALVTVDAVAGTVALAGTARTTRVGRRSAPTRLAGPGGTADGHRVRLLANVGDEAEAAAATAAGAEGIGLLRTELLFADRTVEPSVTEQADSYTRLAAGFAGAPVVVRVLDAGADKPLPYLSAGAEPNPALGLRGLRLLRCRPEVLDRQLRALALAQAETGAQLAVMAPMVATAAEAAWFAERARAAGLERVGVMIEVPAAALTAEAVLAETDFVSVGTNDLGQYTFAAERTAGQLAALNDPWQPALLRLVALVAQAGAATGRPVSVCGEAAADPRLAAVLVGLGVGVLSAAPAVLPAVGELLGGVTLADCQAAAAVALAAADGAAGRAAVAAVFG